jgi:hypothetical protein
MARVGLAGGCKGWAGAAVPAANPHIQTCRSGDCMTVSSVLQSINPCVTFCVSRGVVQHVAAGLLQLFR